MKNIYTTDASPSNSRNTSEKNTLVNESMVCLVLSARVLFSITIEECKRKMCVASDEDTFFFYFAFKNRMNLALQWNTIPSDLNILRSELLLFACKKKSVVLHLFNQGSFIIYVA